MKTTEELKPELKKFFSEDILEYTKKLAGIRTEEYKLNKVLTLTDFPLISSDRGEKIAEVLDFIIEYSYEKAINYYNEGKKIEEKHLRIAGYPMNPFIEEAFKEFSESHLRLCEHYEGLKKKISEKAEEEFKYLISKPKKEPVEKEIIFKNKSRKKSIKSIEEVVCNR